MTASTYRFCSRLQLVGWIDRLAGLMRFRAAEPMPDAGIPEGHEIIVRLDTTIEPEPGAIVHVCIDDIFDIRRYNGDETWDVLGEVVAHHAPRDTWSLN